MTSYSHIASNTRIRSAMLDCCADFPDEYQSDADRAPSCLLVAHRSVNSMRSRSIPYRKTTGQRMALAPLVRVAHMEARTRRVWHRC